MSETPMGRTYLNIEDCQHDVLNDVRGGCSGCNYACDDIIVFQATAAREADARQQLLVDALKALVEEQESNKHQHSGMGLVYLDNARKALKSVEGEAVRAD